MGDEVADLLFEITGQIVVLEQDAVFERLVPALDLALGLRMQRRPADMLHALVFEPVCEIASNVARTVVAQQPGAVNDIHAVEAFRVARRMFFTTCSDDIFGVSDFCLISASPESYDEPEILSSSSQPACLMRAAAGQPGAANLFAYALGFMVAMGCPHFVGIPIGALSQWQAGRIAVRTSGMANAVPGLAFLTGWL